MRLIKPFGILITTILSGIAIVKLLTDGPQSSTSTTQPPVKAVYPSSSRGIGFSALGQLEPSSRILDLAPPTQLTDVQPRIAVLLVEEGQQVRKGQVLAVFDTRDRLAAQREAILLRLKATQDQVRLLNNETSRFRDLASQNAYSKADLEAKELKLLDLKAEVIKIISDLKSNTVELGLSQLKSPITGRVLKIYSRPGERPNPYCLMKLGKTTSMIAIVQVNEEYIGKVSIGQKVMLRSENQGFKGYLFAHVSRIAPIVGVRKSFSVDPKVEADSDSRVIEVEIELDTGNTPNIQNLSGAKVVAIFAK